MPESRMAMMRTILRTILTATLAAALGSCMVGPDYTRPAVDVPKAFIYEPKDAADTANVQWWKQFNDPVLDGLITDTWVPPSCFLAKIWGRRIADRFHGDLREARVIAFNSSLILFEMLARARGLSGWPKILARNRWYQRKVVSFLNSQPSTF